MRSVKLAWPVENSAPITQRFGENPALYARFGLKGHNGVDWGVGRGTAVRAAAAGRVLQAETHQTDGYGHHVLLQHAGCSTLYAHLDQLAVQAGQELAAGQVLGWSGSSGFSTGPHLHFEVRLTGQEKNGFGGAVDPLPLLEETESLPAAAVLNGVRATTHLNLRLSPSFVDTLRGRLRPGDVLSLAGPEKVSAGGYTFVPVVVWVAQEYLQPVKAAGDQCGQKSGDFHILPVLSTVFHRLSTAGGSSAGLFRQGFPRKQAGFPLRNWMSRWMGCQVTGHFSTVFSTGGQDAN